MKRLILSCAILASVAEIYGASLSPGLRTLMKNNPEYLCAPSKNTIHERIAVILTLADGYSAADLADIGFEPDLEAGSVTTGSIPICRLRELAVSPAVVTASEPAQASLAMDIVRSDIGVEKLRDPANFTDPDQIAYTGKGVIIGIIDVGIDTTHPAFLDVDGLPSRIKEFHSTMSAQEHASKHLTSSVVTDPEAIKAIPVENVANGHGTHTASIAAGSYPGNEYGGIAPDADLVLTNVGASIFDDEVIYGMEATRKYAEAQGKPFVVSISIGTMSGPHDGTGAVCEAAAGIADAGGTVLFASGNDGRSKASLTHDFSKNPEPLSTVFEYVYGGPAWNMDLQAWSSDSRPAEIAFEIRDAVGNPLYTSDWISFAEVAEAGGTVAVIDPILSNDCLLPELRQYISGSLDLGMEIYESNSRFCLSLQGRLSNTMMVTGYYLGFRLKSDSGAEMAIYTDPAKASFSGLHRPELTDGNASQSVNDYSTGDRVISVGSTNARERWRNLDGNDFVNEENVYGQLGGISLTSGYGIKWDSSRDVLPQIAAPGNNVIAAFNSADKQMRSNRIAMAEIDGKKYYWGKMSGTSMAAPAAAGVVALWLQANPQLKFDDLLDVLENSCRMEAPLSDTPERVRFGKIDAFEGLKYIAAKHGLSAVDATGAEAGPSIRFSGSEIEILLPGETAESELTVTDMSGRKVAMKNASGPVVTLSRPSAPGVYLLTVSTSTTRTTKKFIVR